MKQENKEKVISINYRPVARCYCPLGEDEYTNYFDISIYPKDHYPDYLDIDSFIQKNIEGKTFTIEQACYCLREYLVDELPGAVIQVTSNVSDAGHSEVSVTL